MPDRYSFQSPFSRGAESNPWFMAGPVAVTTTVFVTAMAALGILIWVVEGGFGGPILGFLELDTSALTRGQVWRFATHIIPPDAQFFWAVLGIVFFFMIGSQFESLLGRRAYTALVAALIVIPPVLGTIVAVATNGRSRSLGSRSCSSDWRPVSRRRCPRHGPSSTSPSGHSSRSSSSCRF